ncbi:hypothetical protein GGF46_004660 [Coemansia sp. RSA 552]|nr:hypothetical protein GGF46_004660 [Coemansia sp. RSA 552]
MSTTAAATAAGDCADATGEFPGPPASLQLQLYQAVPQHPDNLFPHARLLPVHAVPSPTTTSGLPAGRARLAHREQLALHLEGSVKSSLYTLRSQPDVCIQWRILGDRKTLELRPMRWLDSEGSELDPEGEAAASVTSTWCFETPIIGNVVIYDEADSEGSVGVSVTVCSCDGVIYRLEFPSVWMISSGSIDVNACTSWYQVEWCSEVGRLPVLFDGLGADTLVIGCEDAALVWLQWQHEHQLGQAQGSLQGFVTEKVSSSSGILQSVKGFIPRILRRGGSTLNEDSGDQTRLISFALTQVLDGSVQYAVALSRDRRLRFWSSSSGSTCQHEELLPQLDILGCPMPSDPHSAPAPLLDAGSHNYVRVVSYSVSVFSHDSEIDAAQNSVFGVLVFVPDEATPYFTLLQVAIDSQSRISSVQTVMYKACKAANGASQLMADDELVDFQLSHHEELVPQLVEGPGGHAVEEEVSSSYWTLWALWERAQESVVTYTYFSLRPSAAGDAHRAFQFEGHPVLGERWYTVLSQQQAMRPSNDGSQIKGIEARLARSTSAASDEVADGSSQEEPDEASSDSKHVQAMDISKAFLDHLFHPVRFDRGVLEHALGLYEASARDRGFDFPAAPYTVTAASPHLRQRVAAVVGSFLRVESGHGNGTAAAAVDGYHRALFTEWMRYSTLCARIQRVSNAPKSLALCSSTGMVGVIGSNAVMVLQAAGEVEWVHALARKDSGAAVVLSAPEGALAYKYPDLASGRARTEVATLLSAASLLTARMGSDRLLALTEEVAGEASGEMLVSYETRAAELFEKYAAESIDAQHVRHAARMLARCHKPRDAIGNLLQALVQSTATTAMITEADDPQSFKSSGSMDGLFAAGFAMSANVRFEVAQSILVLLICATYHCDAMAPAGISDIPPLLSLGVGVFNLFAIAQWLASQSIGSNSDELLADDVGGADGFLRRFSVLNINRRHDSASGGPDKVETGAMTPVTDGATFGYSLMHEFLNRFCALRFGGRTGVFSDMIAEGVQQVYASLGFSTEWTGSTSLQPGAPSQASLVVLAAKLEKSVPAETTEAFLRLLSKGTAWCYLSGLVSVRMRDFADAADSFASAGVAYNQISEGIRDGVDLQHVLPQAVLESAHAYSYYEHVAELFEAAGYFVGVSQFSHRALESLNIEAEEEGSDIAPEVQKDRQQKLWFKIFHAELECGAYEQAYMAMMANPDAKLQSDCLRHLTGVLCERDGGVAILCRLSFPGLQEEIERNLLFKARHSDLLVRPNYYKILYSFHVYRGNYRNAASAMYQYARRLTTVMRNTGDVARLLVEQGQALLACVNGLSIVDRQYAWVVVGRVQQQQQQQQQGEADSSETVLGDGSSKRKRRRIAIGRYDATSSGQGQDIDIVELEDVRREYALCMARITLGTTFQELFSRNVLLEPEDAIALYVKLGMYDNALSLARTFDLKLDYIFTSLTQKCLELSAISSAKTHREQTPEAFWENQGIQQTAAAGTPGERAWRLLQYYLDLVEDGESKSSEGKGSLHYRLLVADAVLKAEYDAVLAPWLSSLLLRRCPQDLVRLCLFNGCVSEGGEFLLQHINALCSRISATSGAEKKTREFWLPYQLLDQAMGILDDAVARFEQAVDKIRAAKRDDSPSKSERVRLRTLLGSYRERLQGLQRLRDDLRSAVERYMAFAARESRDISEETMA